MRRGSEPAFRGNAGGARLWLSNPFQNKYRVLGIALQLDGLVVAKVKGFDNSEFRHTLNEFQKLAGRIGAKAKFILNTKLAAWCVHVKSQGMSLFMTNT